MANFDKNKFKEFEELADEAFDDESGINKTDAVEATDALSVVEDIDTDDLDYDADTAGLEETEPVEAAGAELREGDESEEGSVTEEPEDPKAFKGSESEVLDIYSAKKKQPHWYVVHTYSGHENKVKVNIEKIVENRGMQDLIQEIVVPTEDVVEIKNGQRKVKTRKMFPGYVIVKMIVTSESWYLVRNTQGVTGFVGHGSDPVPLTNEEVLRMGIEKNLIILDVEVGDTVKVTEGPFENFMGLVEDVNMEKQVLKVRMSVFGRETPVELEFDQVEIIS